MVILHCPAQDYHAAPDIVPWNAAKDTSAPTGARDAGNKTTESKAKAPTAAATIDKQNAVRRTHLSMTQIQQTLVAQCLLPLGSSYLYSKWAFLGPPEP